MTLGQNGVLTNDDFSDFLDCFGDITVVYNNHNNSIVNTIRLTIQNNHALTTCVHK